MIELTIRNKLFSLGGRSAVTNAMGETAFEVKGKVFTLHRTKTVLDANGLALYTVKKNICSIHHKTKILDQSGSLVATVSKKIALRHRFLVTGAHKEIRIEGGVMGFDFNIYIDGRPAGTIQKKLVSLTDTYLLCVEDGADAGLFVALVIAIDNIRDDRRGNN